MIDLKNTHLEVRLQEANCSRKLAAEDQVNSTHVEVFSSKGQSRVSLRDRTCNEATPMGGKKPFIIGTLNSIDIPILMVPSAAFTLLIRPLIEAEWATLVHRFRFRLLCYDFSRQLHQLFPELFIVG